VGANTWQVGNDDNWTTTIRITSNANFVKLGQGKITWNGKSTNTGTNTISEGEISLGTSSGLGTGKLTVAADATLSGNNSKSPLSNSSTTVSGILRPGIIATLSTGTLTFGSKPVTIDEQGVLQITAGRCATATVNGCTSIEDISKLTINGTIRIILNPSNTLQEGDSIRIFRANSLEGTPKFDFQDGAVWDTSRIAEGLLFLISIGVPGDVNSDGTVDVADIAAIIDVMAGNSETFSASADVNGDGTVDVADISTVISIMAENSRRLNDFYN
jgi:hypothetical protein